MPRRALIPAFALALITGCGGDAPPLPMAASPESSRAAITTAFDGWKAGKKPADLLAGNPPLTFIDDDINTGAKLLDYKIVGNGEVRGTGYSYVLTLTLQGKDGQTRTKKAACTAVTTPSHAVSKEDRQP